MAVALVGFERFWASYKRGCWVIEYYNFTKRGLPQDIYVRCSDDESDLGSHGRCVMSRSYYSSLSNAADAKQIKNHLQAACSSPSFRVNHSKPWPQPCIWSPVQIEELVRKTTVVCILPMLATLLGLGLVTALAQRDNVIVFAGARNPAVAADLHALVQQHPGKVHIVKLTSCDKTENEAAVDMIKSIASRLDVVIACAGTCFSSMSFVGLIEVSSRDLSVLRSYAGNPCSADAWSLPSDLHFSWIGLQDLTFTQVNVVGVLVLFQATYPLLKTSTLSPKFIPISSGAGSITDGATMPVAAGAYGLSKAGTNYLARKLHVEHENLSKSIPLQIHSA
jgi:NAD(P)-dependent dehydrogenase (short-subunit alcohol dehydrogenase family)